MSMPSLLLEHDAYSPQVLEQATHIYHKLKLAQSSNRNERTSERGESYSRAPPRPSRNKHRLLSGVAALTEIHRDNTRISAGECLYERGYEPFSIELLRY